MAVGQRIKTAGINRRAHPDHFSICGQFDEEEKSNSAKQKRDWNMQGFGNFPNGFDGSRLVTTFDLADVNWMKVCFFG
jgi:hypothetical protein